MADLGTKEFWKRLQDDPAALAAEVCSVDVANLDQTLQRHAALRAWVAAAFEVARITEERLKWELTKMRAMVLLTAKIQRDPHTGDEKGKNQKVKTLAVLEAEVDTHCDVQDCTTALHNQQEIKGVLRAMTTALEDRKDMLIQIAAKQRQEAADYKR